MIDYVHKIEPYEHQRHYFELSRDREVFGILDEQGTGKTKTIIDTGAWLYGNNKIDAVFILAMNGVHTNWVKREIPTHIPDHIPWKGCIYRASRASTKKFQKELNAVMKDDASLKWLAMNIEAVNSSRALKTMDQFLKVHRCLFVIDESDLIKNPKAKRTKKILARRLLAVYRRIMTGTPITEKPDDAFTQMQFLDPEILGFQSYWVFKHHFGEYQKKHNSVQGRDYEELVRYRNLDELKELMAKDTSRVLKADCLDIPDKVYKVRYVELTREQRRVYDMLRDELLLENPFEPCDVCDGTGEMVHEEDGMEFPFPCPSCNGGYKVTGVQMAITRIMRLHQITNGFYPEVNEPIDDHNPRIDLVAEEVERHGRNSIIWSKYRPAIPLIRKALEAKGRVVGEYHGDVPQSERDELTDRFQDPNDPLTDIITTQGSGGRGLTWTAATLVIYFSNGYSLSERLQSEDRAHRSGQRNVVTYLDIIAEDTVDEQIRDALVNKKSVADSIVRGDPRAWFGLSS